MIKIPKRKEGQTWTDLEKDIQVRAKNKDRSFRIKGKWKKFVKLVSGYKVFAVNGKWIRTNLCVYFGHGGHGFVHEFIPLDEIWISLNHPHEGNSEFGNCNCKLNTKGQKLSKNYFESTIIHEITECENMKKGKSFWESHNLALEKEREINLLSDPYNDR